MKPILIAIVLSAIACTMEEVEPVGYGEGLGTPENPIPSDDAYELASRITLAVDTQPIESTVATVRAFSQNPARTLLAEAQRIGTPALQELYSALSTTLRNQLETWINAEIDKARLAGKTVRQYSADLAEIAKTTLTQFTVDSKLTMSPTGMTHAFIDLNFRPASLDIIIPIGGLDADILTQRSTVAVTPGGALALGDQKFGLALGSHAWHATNLASKTIYGSDVGTALVVALDCTRLAEIVATKCLSGSCVGHATQLRVVCDAGVKALVDGLQTRMPEFSLDVFRFVTGHARLVDDNLDGLADAIVDGTWDTEVNLGFGLHQVATTFATPN